MVPRLVLIGVRCALLLGLAAWLAVSVTSSVLADHPVDRRPADLDVLGIRVLLTRDGPQELDAAEPVDPGTWSQINVTVGWRALLYCPADPGNLPQARLPEGSRLRIIANNQSGLTISSDHEPTDQTWNVQEVRLIPYPEDLPPAIANDPGTIARDDIEAPGGIPLFSLAGRDYRGTLTVRRSAWKSLRAVNQLPLVAWLDGVLQTEASAAWPPTALEALAIVARSHALIARLRGGTALDGLGYHLEDRLPAYRGTGASGERIRAALVATRGQVLTWLGDPFAPPYHLSSGGYLAAIDRVFRGGSTTLDGERLTDVMPADRDPWCHPGALAVDPGRCWEQETTFNSDDIKRATDRVFPDRGIGWVHAIEVDGDLLGPQGELRRADVVRLVWYGGSMELPAETFREILAQAPADPDRPAVRLPSSLWTADSPAVVEPVRERRTWRIVSYGEGHGVGLSLASAYHLASLEPPMPAREILAAFYKQAQVDLMDRFLPDPVAAE